jgi:hypothetical protein
MKGRGQVQMTTPVVNILQDIIVDGRQNFLAMFVRLVGRLLLRLKRVRGGRGKGMLMHQSLCIVRLVRCNRLVQM